jgi:hypothetical protein
MAPDDLIELELMLNRFKRLLAEFMRGNMTRNCFHSWEIDLLIDFMQCEVNRRRRTEILKQYERAVERQLQSGSGPPMKLSAFLEQRAKRREQAAAAARQEPDNCHSSR